MLPEFRKPSRAKSSCPTNNPYNRKRLTMAVEMKEAPGTQPGDGGNRPNGLILIAFIALGIIVAALLPVFLPNLPQQPLYLALLAATSIVVGLSLGLRFSGMRKQLSKTVERTLSGVLIALVVADMLFLVAPVFLPGQTANEKDPFATAAQPTAVVTTVAPTTAAATTNAATTAAAPATAAATTVVPTIAAATVIATTAAPTTVATTAAPTTAVATTAAPTTAIATTAAPLRMTGEFSGRGNYKVAGAAILGKTPDGKNILRFENFNSSNGPDLVVYLVKDATPNGVNNGIQVAPLRATQGNLNFELPADLNPSEYKSVVIWCKAFSVTFGVAGLK
jgi:Electron transfer DM13